MAAVAAVPASPGPGDASIGSLAAVSPLSAASATPQQSPAIALATSGADVKTAPVATGTATAAAATGAGAANGGAAKAAAPHDPLTYLRALGDQISDGAKKSYGRYISPLFAAVVARALTLEKSVEPRAAAKAGAKPKAAVGLAKAEQPLSAADLKADADPYSFAAAPLSQHKEHELVQLGVARCIEANNPLLECMRMAVTFESTYAHELHTLRARHTGEEKDTATALGRIVDVGSALTSPQAVANLYRSIFRLMLAHSGVEKTAIDKNVEREIAAALESVFPQAGLNAFHMMNPDDKRKQIAELLPIVLGIRLFNREINKGGAGLIDVPVLCSDEVDALYESLEIESTEMGDLCQAYAGVLELEYEQPRSISGSVASLTAELTNRRQYVLLVHQLQHECLDSIDTIRDARARLREHMEQLRTLVGLRTSVPKDQVYPKFLAIAALWQQLTRERVKNKMRATLLRELSDFKANFTSSLLEADLQAAKDQRGAGGAAAAAAADAKKRAEPDSFVKTLTQKEVEADAELEADGKAGASGTAGGKPVRIVKEQTKHFMALPLQFQGFCPWTIAARGGLLLAGNPHFGLIKYNSRYYAFTSTAAMRDFVADPERYVEGVIRQGHKTPALIHLLSLQEYIPYADIADLIATASADALATQRTRAAAAVGVTAGALVTKVDAWTQTNPKHVQYDPPDPNYDWNEWNLRRKAIQLANLMSKRTHGTQTNLSHFRRDNETQYTLPLPRKDGSMPGKGTQTGVSKGTNVERTTRYLGGLRGVAGPTQLAVSTLTIQPVVAHGSNPPLNDQYKRWAGDPNAPTAQAAAAAAAAVYGPRPGTADAAVGDDTAGAGVAADDEKTL